jgi:hypothetical protein
MRHATRLQLLVFIVVVCAILVPQADAGPAPGAFPPTRFFYADSWTGWPVAPLHRQHPIRGSFLDPRTSRHLHWGIDISVNDERPEAGAPSGRTHRVYAVEGGIVRAVRDRGYRCGARNIAIGHFSYWHVDPTLRPGQYVRAGTPIGWTCVGLWHLHLGERAVIAGKTTWINPLHARGKIRPYRDTAPPVFHEIGFYTPAMPPDRGTRLEPDKLKGIVDMRAWVADPQSFRGWMVGRYAPLLNEHHPYEISMRLTQVETGRRWSWTVFRGDVWLGAQIPRVGGPVPFWYHYAPGTRQNRKPTCLARPQSPNRPNPCSTIHWLRLFALSNRAYWDTRRFANGVYRIRVTASDIAGNTTSTAVGVRLAN